jgi:hypothetical protein
VKQQTFDALMRSLFSMPSRRHLLHGLAGAGLGLGVSRFPAGVEGKKRKPKKRKPRKAKPNEFGCLSVGQTCKSGEQCCSGICDGKKGKKTCRAHDTGNCEQGGPQICTSGPPQSLTCNNEAYCRCFGTTAGSIVCSRFDQMQSCADCQQDADCIALGFPPGSACAPVSVGPCGGQCESGMACVIPCGAEFPEPTN